MAINPESIASWGLIGGTGGTTQIIEGMDITLEASEPIEVTLEADSLTVEIDDE